MGIFVSETRSRGIEDDFWYSIWPFGRSSAGVDVDEYNALQSPTFWACVNNISQDIASTPIHVYHRIDDKKRERAYSHWSYSILHGAPNPEMTASSFKQTLQGHVLTWGNWYVNAERKKSGRVKGLWLLRPDRVEVKRIKGTLVYKVSIPSMGENRLLYGDEIIHMPGFGFDGVTGYSVVRMFLETIGLAKAQEKYSAKFYENGAIPPIALTHPAKLSETAQENMRTSWEKAHMGLDRAHRVAILQEGVDIKTIGVPPADAQLAESKKLSSNEVVKIFRMPLHKVQEMDRSTFNNIAEENVHYYLETMRFWYNRTEETYNKSFYGDDNSYYCEFLIDDILRGDIKTRNESLEVQRRNGIISANEWRRIENMNPIEGDYGDDYIIPLNMIPASQLNSMSESVKNKVKISKNEQNNAKDVVKTGETVKKRSKNDAFHEKRANNIIIGRNRLRNQYFDIIKDAANAIVTKEGNAIRKNAKKLIKQPERSAFSDWLTKYYKNNMPEYIRSKLGTVFRSYSDAVRVQIAQELDIDINDITDVTQFTEEYIERYIERHIDSSIGQVDYILTGKDNDGNDIYDDKIESIDERIDEWFIKRPEKIALNETVRAEGAIASFLIFSAGYKLVWRIQGKETCPYCESLNGKIIEQNGSFADDGDEIDVEGQDSMLIRGIKTHPPLHAGCDCIAIAEI